jgi:hypothetical protein
VTSSRPCTERRLGPSPGTASPVRRPARLNTPRLAWPNGCAGRTAALAERLREAAQPLLAGLVGWHGREDRPRWWEFFRVEDLDDEMLVEDGSTIGGLSAPAQVGEVKASWLWRYDLEPQECKLSLGST